MTTRLFAAAGVLSFALLTACDSESRPDRDVAADGSDDDTDDDGDDDTDTDDEPEPVHGPVLAAAPPATNDDDHGPGMPDGLHPCGDGSIDAGEECDDGLGNGDDRECTLSCTLNDCDLDEHGVCDDPHWPAADVDLYPCTETIGAVLPCGVGVTAP